MKAKTFDRKFDSGGKIVDQLDLSKARRIGTDAKRVNVEARGADGFGSTPSAAIRRRPC